MSPADDSETQARPPDETAAQAVGSHASSTARFTPGELLAGRYRIIAPLGKGGMGEVYRADDIRLGQPVALKFLPAALAGDSERLERLVDEVRIGRQISHPNVCRLYDIAEAEGHHFLVMEYVDGEDLASLLRRIGRFPGDKALDIARGICAGLTAAHDKGIIHRDLKPANVMIDGRGHARIADFGLAALTHSGAISDMSGTPQYMAPEQLTGEGASLRSDVYALGLVMHEMLTGKRVFEAKSMNELRALHAETAPSSLSSSATDVDPALDRVIKLCLAKVPGDRPASARVVLASLPGGDALEAALLAGETPSPEMVAAAAIVGDVSVRQAWALLLLVIAALAGTVALAGRISLHGLVPLPRSPEVLLDRARQIVERLAPETIVKDRAWGIEVDRGYLQSLEGASRDLHVRLRADHPGALRFWYRSSPEPIVARTWVRSLPWEAGARVVGRVTRTEPPPRSPGSIEVVLDPSGGLVRFVRIPTEDAFRSEALEGATADMAAVSPSPLDPAALFELAGLDPSRLVSDPPDPGEPGETSVWAGTFALTPSRPLRVIATLRGGRLGSFEVEPVGRPAGAEWRADDPSPSLKWAIRLIVMGGAVWIGFFFVLLARNLRSGRSDRRAAFRFALFGGLSAAVGLKLQVHFPPSLIDFNDLWLASDAQAVYWAVFGALVYLGIEPILRKTLPLALVSWTRLVSGRVRDPLVGRDVLVGVAVAALVVLIRFAGASLPLLLGDAPSEPRTSAIPALSSPFEIPAILLTELLPAALVAVFFLLAYVVNLAICRQRDLAGLSIWVIFAGVSLAQSRGVAGALSALVLSTAFVWVLLRVGLLAAMVTIYVITVLIQLPLTSDPSAWYAGTAAFGLLVIFSLAIYGFVIALAGKPMFGRPVLEA